MFSRQLSTPFFNTDRSVANILKKFRNKKAKKPKQAIRQLEIFSRSESKIYISAAVNKRKC